ncbi:hypothetical protein ACQKDY_14765 [Alteromonas macleodii]|uniref:hypothetical protein n=1 Tax=Alteromonas macleodii TaxID=28108 RepID=UPI003CFDBD31
MAAVIFQRSKYNIKIPIIGSDNSEVSADSFIDPEYLILDTSTGEHFLKLTMGDGISTEGNLFVIELSEQVTSSLIPGNFCHQFRVKNLAGEYIPPLFKEDVVIEKVHISPS